MKKVLLIIGGSLGLLGVLLTAALYLSGGRLSFIQTPSMATYAPVGSLVMTLPTQVSELQAGDTILFKAPGGQQDYFHRIQEVTPEGLLTAGDLNGSMDPWVVTDAELQGKELFHSAGLGYLLKAIPLLFIGGMLIHLVTRTWVVRYWRTPLRVFGWTILTSVLLTAVVPLVKVSVISQTVIDGEATTVFVPTGLWSVDATAFGGTTAEAVAPGELTSVVSSQPDATDQFSVVLGPHMDTLVWAFMVGLWLVPLAVTMLHFFYARHQGLDIITLDAQAEQALPQERADEVAVPTLTLPLPKLQQGH